MRTKIFSTSSEYDELQSLLKEKVLFIDGATGTSIQARGLSAADFGGGDYEGCNEILNLVLPELVTEVHTEYLSAGADIIETNTFGATPLVLGEYGLADKAFEINLKSAGIAVTAARSFMDKSGRRVFVAGSMGPTNRAFSVTGGVSFSELAEGYRIQAAGLLAGGVDILLLETIQDAVNMKAGMAGIREAVKESGISRPLIISVSVDNNGRLLSGHSLEALVCALAHSDILALGLNCALGPEMMLPHLRHLSRISPFFVMGMPNAGLPDENGAYTDSPQIMCAQFSKEKLSLNLLGGCCGTTPAHIAALKDAFGGLPPRPLPDFRGENPLGLTAISGVDALEVEAENRPLLVGERMNVIGSRRFKKLICEERFVEALNPGLSQVRSGAQLLDICLSNPERNELEDWESILPELCRRVRVPIMIDTTDDAVFARALPVLPGKCVLNSVNLEHGEERFERVSELLRLYGGLLVVGLIDENAKTGMAVSCEHKMAIARRSYELLTQKYGLKPTDLIFDPLVFPCGTGDEKYLCAAGETIAALRHLHEEFPACKTILGISNVSFGLPEAGREALNSVFLYHCTRAGLDFAIVNAKSLRRYNSLSDREKELCENLILHNSRQSLENFAEFFRHHKGEDRMAVSQADPEQMLIEHVLQGNTDGLDKTMQAALEIMPPADILNNSLLEGMRRVGVLFNDGQLIVAEVLESAAVMKAAANMLEPYLKTGDSVSGGKFLLATVKGDVHDIGKNLVRSILSNNGYEIIDLGTRVEATAIIKAVRELKPDYIGLSGLLVKSALEMVDTASELQKAGINLPLIVGGAALSEKFCEKRLRPVYDGPVFFARDAMDGLNIVNALSRSECPCNSNSCHHGSDVSNSSVDLSKLAEAGIQVKAEENLEPSVTDKSVFLPDHSSVGPQPSSMERVLMDFPDMTAFLQELPEKVFFRRYMGLKGALSTPENVSRTREMADRLTEIKAMAVAGKWFSPRAVFAFFPAFSVDNELHIPEAEDRKGGLFRFPVLKQRSGFCLARLVGARTKTPLDTIALFAATGGSSHLALAAEFEKQGDYFAAHALLALGVECAEMAAVAAHREIRRIWNIADGIGERFSFGYPACPELSDQKTLFDLINAGELGINLTENYMMVPENSVSGIVFAHAEARLNSGD